MISDETDAQLTAPPIEEMMAEADKALNDGDLATAQISYALVIEREPANVDALYKLGYVHSRTSSPAVAVSLLRHALQQNPSHQASRQLLGTVLLQMEEIDEAEKAFEAVIEADPGAWQSINAMGVIRDLQARHAEARQLFERALEFQPRSAKILNNLGYSHYLSGSFHEAEQLFLDAVRFDSRYERAWANLALIYSREGRFGDANAAFRKIVSEHQAANNVGYLGLLQGDTAVANEQLSKAIRLSPSYYEVANRNLEVMKENRVSLLAMPQVKKQIPMKRSQSREPAEASTSRTVPVRMTVPSRPRYTTDRLTTERIQAYLNFLGYDAGKLDGSMGRATRRAIREFQQAHELIADGKVGWSTGSRLALETNRAVQGVLQSLGFSIPSSSGIVDAETVTAIKQFQRQHGLPQTGNLDSALLEKLMLARRGVTKRMNSDDYLDINGRG